AAAPDRRARGRLQRGARQAQPELPGLRRPADDHRVRRLRRVLRAMSTVRVPPVLREDAGGAREVEATGDTLRALLEDLSSRLPALGERIYDGEQIRPFVNVYVDGEDVRTLG